MSRKEFLSGGKSLRSSMNTKSLRRTLHLFLNLQSEQQVLRYQIVSSDSKQTNTLTCTSTHMHSHSHGYTVCTATTALIYIYSHPCPLKHTQTHTPLPSDPPLTPLWPSTLPYSGPPGALSSLGTAHGALEFQYHSLQKNIFAQRTLLGVQFNLGVQFKVWPILRERLDWLYCFQKETYGKKEGWEKCI